MRSRVRVVAAAVLLAIVVASAPASAEGPAVNGGGSSFAALEIDQWRADVARKPYQLKVNYVSQGSSFGRLQYAAGTLDFGASDIPFQPGELPASSPRSSFAYVPVSAGGIGFMFNVTDSTGRRLTDLKLTRRAVCRIFTEPGMKWSDPDLVAHNPTLEGVDRDILPVVRQDGSGTSYVFSEFCISVASDVWQAFIDRMRAVNEGALSDEFKARKPISNWPTGWGRVTSALAADGVANAVADPVSGRDAITYNEAGFAKVRGFPNAKVQNAAGAFLLPDEDAVTVALGYAVPNTVGGSEDGTFSLNFAGADPRAYFPSTYSYVIAQTQGFATDKGNVLSRFLCYAVTKGQESAVALGYARLSSVLVDLALRQIAKIPGYPGAQECVVASAAPPPPPAAVTVDAVVPVAGGPAAGGAGGAPAGTATTVAGRTAASSRAQRRTAGSGAGAGTVTGPAGATAAASDTSASPAAGAEPLPEEELPSTQPVNAVDNGHVVRLVLQGMLIAALVTAMGGGRRRDP